MKIAIIGVGAMGSVYAGFLANAGNEVWALDVQLDHIEAIRKRGLRIEGISGDRVVEIAATTDANDVGPCDLVVIATKAMHVKAAAKSARPLLRENTTVLTIQNGIGSFEKVASLLGKEKIAIGVAGGFGASIKGPGHVHHNGMELIRFGEMVGPVTTRLKKIADIWSDAGFNVKTYDDIQRMVWEKLICNVCFSGVCTVSHSQIRMVLNNTHLWKIAKGCTQEAYQVAQAKGIQVSFDEPIAYARAFGEKMPDARPSMLLDHMAGKASEIDAINGAIVREGKAMKIPVPFNTVISSLIIAEENKMGWR